MRSKIFQRILDETPEDVEIFIDWYADLVIRINELLDEQNLSRKELAHKLDKNPSEISKWLSGEHNFTLRSLAKLSAELGEPLLEVPKKKPVSISIEDGFVRREHTFVSYTNKDIKPDTKSWQSTEETALSNPWSHAG